MKKTRCKIIFLNTSFLILLLSSLLLHLLHSSEPIFLNQIPSSLDTDIGCKKLHIHPHSLDKCSYIKSHKGCQARGYISYIQLFYCYNITPPLAYILLTLWLILLFYILGDTSANYFCPSLEGLSNTLRLPPTIAGVTLLSLGNGAPDLFATIISFTGDGDRDVGLNGILGSAFFVSSVVVGIINIIGSNRSRPISKYCFVRDVCFLIFALSVLLLIIGIGKISIWVAILFLCLYFVYVVFVCALRSYGKGEMVDVYQGNVDQLPISMGARLEEKEECLVLEVPLLGYRDAEQKGNLCGKIVYLLELPLELPRKLTIPMVSEERWSKPFAVMSCTIAPILLSVIWNSHCQKPSLIIYGIGGSMGFFCGLLVGFTTEKSSPPRKCLLAWFGAAFVMSITWTYILAEELVSLLVSLGLVLGINPSILGLTVLAWGNSLGDLVANVAISRHGGADGAQVAISGCYAGPVFDIVVGLGLPFLVSAWNAYPSRYTIPDDPFVYETVGFLMGGLLWALVIITKKNMRLTRLLGVGLLVIYLCFLSVKMGRSLGLLG